MDADALMAGWYQFCYTQALPKPGFPAFSGMTELGQRLRVGKSCFPISRIACWPKKPSRVTNSFLRWGGFEQSVGRRSVRVLSVTEGDAEKRTRLKCSPCPMRMRTTAILNDCFLSTGHPAGCQSRRSNRVEPIAKPGEELRLMLDPQNDVESHAVAVRTQQDRPR